MKVDGRTAIVTGAAGGIGAALARALAEAGARVLVADLDGGRAEAVAAAIPGGRAIGVGGDVSREDELRRMIATAERELGPVDLFAANAGVSTGVGLGYSDREWQQALEVNLLAHVRAARLLVPAWIERGGGYFVATASAAGLLTQIGSAPYAVTKHGAVGFAEWLAVTYGAEGVRVSCLCPMGVKTGMLDAGIEAIDPAERLPARSVAAAGSILEPDAVARATLEAIAEERFLVLPHLEVLEYFRRKASDYDRWLAGMRRLQGELAEPAGG